MDQRRGAGLDRRALLRGALTVGGGVAVSAALAACTTGGTTPDGGGRASTAAATRQPSPASTGGAHALPRELATIPSGYTRAADRPGTLVELRYDTYESMTYEQKTRKLRKRAIVYLPDGYTDTRKYDVFYLMHGGWSNETGTLGTPGRPSGFKNVLDNAIADGRIEPMIVVCPTYNNTSQEDSADFGLALTLNENYHHELLNDLLPAVEGRYSGYAEDTTADGLKAARDHRGFGGFSMGAVATWRTFQYGLDYFRYFLPMSCGTSLDMDTILTAARGHDPSDFFVWVITGTEDFAQPFDQDRVELMRRTSGYAEADSEQDGNFAYRVKQGYSHGGVAATEYTYNGLRWFWGA